ncbi:adenylate cyclase [Catalinimonas alkaloidigena]|uniref:helix-turn-helix domain-containing protein n=1 Tax=Catalinimonas alkaloidigena TaxID=1075417 RepID=UPI0024058523|nr:helix-turn-helix domain-containing protein [Catalinimonas alkaloidigena]MDF9798145.1 adenylate cyclase [Catalinimonas alkaloidigena]
MTSPEESSLDHAFLEKLTDVVLQNLNNEQFGVQDLSAQVGISRSHLHRKLKLLRGKSVSRFIREVRLNEAIKLLQQDAGTASEIAYRVGFNSPTYFHRCFRKHYGYAPGEIKNRKYESKSLNPSLSDTHKHITHTKPFLHPEVGKVRQTKRYRVIFLILLLLVLVSTFIYFYYQTVPSQKSIAVLPLHNFTGEEDQEYFVNGFHDALIGSLGQISALRVISRTSTLRYQESNMLLQDIARELGVDAIVEGSVMGTGNQIRIQLQLIEAFPEEQHLWAQDYQQEISGIIALQNDVVKNIAREIQVTLTPEEELLLDVAPKVNPDAYRAYLKGVFYWDRLTEEDLNTSLQYFELAKTLDPENALAYAGVCLVWIGRLQQGLVPYEKGIISLQTAARKALKLDSTLAEVHYILGGSGCWVGWDYEEAEKSLRKAIALNPNYSAARAYLSHVLIILNKPEEAMEQIALAMELDPFNDLYRALYGMDLNFTRQYDKAIALFGEDLKKDVNHLVALSTLRTSYHMKSMYQEALEVWKVSYAKRADQGAMRALEKGAEEGGYHRALEKLAEYLIERSESTYVTPWRIATLYTRAGNKVEALKWLEKAYEAHDSNMPYIGVDPIFDILRPEERYQSLLEKMNLPVNHPPIAEL